jgi:VanZ family protein
MAARILLRILCVGYFILLTFFLWVPDPTLHREPYLLFVLKWVGEVIHFLTFFAFTPLVFAARWPVPRWLLCFGLVGYGMATEYCQRFFPPRSPHLAHALQNLAGIATGLAAVWVAETIWSYVARRFLGKPDQERFVGHVAVLVVQPPSDQLVQS